ncbi:DUF6199 family natural product biosynthesis protein [Paenibacillus sp. sgz500958]|uniref:DUF6199 family natural product biosynthesis protein n=1 Tax=Paenibacillus sp. sgz500958 TaxID=3242475 RepID=UPI0036D31720
MFAGIFVMILGLSVIAYGLFIRRNPTFGWRMNEGWKVKGDGEPSEAYIEAVTFSGAAAIWVGAFFAVAGFALLL